MATLKENRDYLQYQVQHLQEKYWLDQLRFNRKHNKLYIQSKIWRQKPIKEGIKECIAYIDGLYEGFKIKENKSDLTSI